VVLLVCLGLATWDHFELKSSLLSNHWLRRAVWIGCGSLPISLYTWLAVRADPVLAAWNAQNLTLSPPWWDIALSLSPALPVAILGAWRAVGLNHQRARPAILWAVLALLLVYLPFGLQRRFLIGIYIPIALLAVSAFQVWQANSRMQRLTLMMLVILSLPSNLVVMLAAWQEIASKDDRIYLSVDEIHALQWIETNTASNALVLAGAESGLLIPGWTGRRVIYGHPFETVDAQTEKKLVEAFYSGEMSPQEAWEMLAERGIDIVYMGPREKSKSISRASPVMEHLELAYTNPTIDIYRVIHERTELSRNQANYP
jgi:hypothetical protein